MKRKVTPEEREILLNNPELVMFEPYGAFKTHHASLFTTLIPPVIVAAIAAAVIFLFPDFVNSHDTAFAVTATLLLIAACAFIPFFYFFLDDRAYKKARETHYAKYLRMLLPEDLECNIATIDWIEVQKAEGGWTVDGEKGLFSYSSFVNYFKFFPQTDVAFVTGEKFFAYIKRDPKTESLYQDFPVRD
ncbi:MAG: hypothetical protein SPL61_05150 [Saccharofermentans sp.]|nr:hypothetical protein [Saccharofermentans sp.]